MKEKKLTGYPSIDKPWLKYYSEEAVNAPLPECTLYEYLWECNKDHLNDIALNYFDRKISFGELFANIKKAADALSTIGVRKGDIVIIASVTTPETIYAVYALNRIGAISNLIDPRTSVEGIKDYIMEVDAKYAITLDVVYPKIAKVAKEITIKKIIVSTPADSLPQLKKFLYNLSRRLKREKIELAKNCLSWQMLMAAGMGKEPASAGYQKASCCAIEHTGGTTGMPKGVMLTDDNFNAASFQIKYSKLRMRRQDKFLNIMPPFIAYGMVLGIHTALTHGWHSVIIPSFDPSKFAELILKYKPAGIMGVPSYFEGLMHDAKLDNIDLSYIHVVLVGGDKTQIEFEKKVNSFFAEHNANIHLSKGYSMTEASSTATFTFEEINKIGSNGIPWSKTILSAFEPGTDNELKVNVSGEICICSPTMMIGYYGKQNETDKVLKLHSDGNVWIHSGDLGHIDEDGCVYIDGRLKRMIIRHDGFKVFPPFIENVVASHAAIETCCAVGMPDKQHSQGYLPVVFATAKKEDANNTAELKKELEKLCAKELPEYAQPVAFYFKDTLPHTAIGKIDYRALEKEAEKL